jgi:hypothetical protein
VIDFSRQAITVIGKVHLERCGMIYVNTGIKTSTTEKSEPAPFDHFTKLNDASTSITESNPGKERAATGPAQGQQEAPRQRTGWHDHASRPEWF